MFARPGFRWIIAGLAAWIAGIVALGWGPAEGALLSSLTFVVPIVLLIVAALVGLGGSAPTGWGPGKLTVLTHVGPLVLVSVVGSATLASTWIRDQDAMLASSLGAEDPTEVRASFVLLTAREQGLAAALALLREQIEVDPELLFRSHHLAHQMGQISIEEAGFDLAVIQECSFDFASGCFHGMLQQYFGANPGLGPDSVAILCQQITGDGDVGAKALECAHGLGHGLAIRAGHDPDPAARECDLLGSPVEQRECYDGVFMEVTTMTTGMGHESGGGHAAMDHSSADASPGAMMMPDDFGDASASPCGLVATRYREACWAYDHIRILADPDRSAHRVRGECSAAGEEALIAACLFGAGKQTSAENFYDWPAVYAWCGEVGSQFAPACIDGAVEHLIDFEWSTDMAARFCEGAPDALTPSCYLRLGTRLGFLHDEATALERCDALDAAYRDECRIGVRGSVERRASARIAA